jgi:hypothetical protein
MSSKGAENTSCDKYINSEEEKNVYFQIQDLWQFKNI